MTPPEPWSKLDPPAPAGVRWHGDIRLVVLLAEGATLPGTLRNGVKLGPTLWVAWGRFEDLDLLEADSSVLEFSIQQPLDGP